MRHEQSLADLFNKYLAYQAQQRGVGFHSFSLDGQDRDTGADYVLTGEHQFSLVEFKYAATDLKTEAKKPRRFELCKALAGQARMRALHDRCHFVAWGQEETVYVNNYRAEICNQGVFGTECGISNALPNREFQVRALEFAEDFLTGGSRSLDLSEFEDYLSWLLSTSESPHASVELLTYDPYGMELRTVGFPSVGHAHQWLLDRWQHRQTPSPAPGPERPRM